MPIPVLLEPISALFASPPGITVIASLFCAAGYQEVRAWPVRASSSAKPASRPARRQGQSFAPDRIAGHAAGRIEHHRLAVSEIERRPWQGRASRIAGFGEGDPGFAHDVSDSLSLCSPGPDLARGLVDVV